MKTADFRPEIKDDELFYKIIDLVKDKKPRTILEIGSATGLGSTQAFIKGIEESGIESVLCCIESVESRFNTLVSNTSKYPFIHCIRASSVPVSQLMTEQQIEKFWNEHPKLGIRRYSLKMIKGWMAEDIKEVSDAPQNGIELANKFMVCDCPNMVLIDGSAFSGYAELVAVMGSDTIILDDTMDIKNWESFHKLSNGNTLYGYRLIAENRKYRNGYAIFERILDVDADNI